MGYKGSEGLLWPGQSSRVLSWGWGVPDPAHPSGNGSWHRESFASLSPFPALGICRGQVPPEAFMESFFHPSKTPAGFVQLFAASRLEIPGVTLLSQPIPVNLNTFLCCSGLQQGRHPCAQAWAQFVILSEI